MTDDEDTGFQRYKRRLESEEPHALFLLDDADLRRAYATECVLAPSEPKNTPVTVVSPRTAIESQKRMGVPAPRDVHAVEPCHLGKWSNISVRYGMTDALEDAKKFFFRVSDRLLRDKAGVGRIPSCAHVQLSGMDDVRANVAWFDRPMCSDEVVKYLAQHHFRVAVSEELVSYSHKHIETGLTAPVIALGTHHPGYASTEAAGSYRRALTVCWAGAADWPSETRFLIIEDDDRPRPVTIALT